MASQGTVHELAAAADFDRDVMHADLPVLVDFWAPWCPPCVALAPQMERLADAFAGRLRVVKVNVAAFPEIAERFGVQSIPAFLVVVGGVARELIVGGWNPDSLRPVIEQHLAAPRG